MKNILICCKICGLKNYYTELTGISGDPRLPE